MKKFLLLVCFLFVVIFNYGQNLENAAKHVGAGIVIGGVGGYAAHKIFQGQRGWTWAGAVGSSLAAGLAKETYDRSRAGVWQTDDILYTTLGGVISGLALDLVLKNTGRRGGNRRGKNCGCLVINISQLDAPEGIVFNTYGSGSLSSNIQASYFIKEVL